MGDVKKNTQHQTEYQKWKIQQQKNTRKKLLAIAFVSALINDGIDRREERV